MFELINFPIGLLLEKLKLENFLVCSSRGNAVSVLGNI
jgi:hypothetical protein